MSFEHHAPPVPPRMPPEMELEVRKEAYALYVARNGAPGDPEQDWHDAERRVRARHAADPEGIPASPKAFETAVAVLHRKELEATAVPPTPAAVKAAQAVKKAKTDAAIAAALEGNGAKGDQNGKGKKKK